MIKLTIYELRKMWSKKSFLFFASILLFANVMLLFINERTGLEKNAQAYRILSAELSILSMEEKVAVIDEHYRCINSINVIDQIHRAESYGVTGYSKALRKDNADIIDEFQNTYQSGSYLTYTDNLYSEYMFITEIKDEIDKVANYEAYLKNIEKKAEDLSQISIFKSEKGNSYSEHCIQAEAAAFEDMYGIETDYLPEKGIMSALNFSLSDVILIAFVMLMASVLLREEKDSGMLALNFSMPGGRIKTAVAKLFAVFISLLAAVGFIYCANLLFYHFIYGLGNLDRSVQSLPSLMQCTWKVSIRNYLLLFFLAKWISAVIVSAWLMLCTYLLKNIFISWGAGLAFIGINFLIRIGISATGYFNLFRYMNIFSFMNTNEVLGRYIQLYFFGRPMPILVAECISGCAFIIIFVTVFLITYHKGIAIRMNWPQLVFVKNDIKKSQRKAVKTRLTGLTRYELYKLLRMNGAALVFGAYMIFIIFQVSQRPTYVSLDEEIYKSYMTEWSGIVTDETVALINEENARFKPIYDLDDALQLGVLANNQYQDAMMAYQGLKKEKNVFDRIISQKLSYLEEHPSARLVYDTGYEILFDSGGADDLYEMVILFVVIILGFGNMFSVEKLTGMEKILATTPLGKKVLAAKKIQISRRITSLLAIFSLLPRYFRVGVTYGYSQLVAPAQSLEMFAQIPEWIPILVMMFLQVLLRVYIGMVAVYLVLYLSQKTGNTLLTYFSSALFLELCPMLYLFGVKPMIWFSLWPLFHFPGILYGDISILLPTLYHVICLGLMIEFGDFLLNNFGSPKSLDKCMNSLTHWFRINIKEKSK